MNLEILLKDFLNNKVKYPKELVLNIVNSDSYTFTDNKDYFIVLKNIKILKKDLMEKKFMILKDWKFIIKNEEIDIKFKKYKLKNFGYDTINLNKTSKNLTMDNMIIALKNNKIIKSLNIKKNKFDIFTPIKFEEIISTALFKVKNKKSFTKKIKLNYNFIRPRKSPFKFEKFDDISYDNDNKKESCFTKSTFFTEKEVKITNDDIFNGLIYNYVDLENLFISKSAFKSYLKKYK